MRLTPELVLYFIDQGMKQSEVAREYGVTRQYVNRLAKQGGYVSSMTIINDHLPWEFDTSEYQENTLYQVFRLTATYNLEGDKAFINAPSSRRKVRSFVKRLTIYNQVIDFDPDYPPIPGVVNSHGFAYVPRSPEDDDFMMKIRPGVRVTNVGNRIWRLPPMF